jgi:hypothetical protein
MNVIETIFTGCVQKNFVRTGERISKKEGEKKIFIPENFY